MSVLRFTEQGDRENSTLVCVPGLLGGPNDFAAMNETLEKHFHIIVIDPDPENARLGSSVMNEDVLKHEVVSSSAPDFINEILQSMGKKEAYLFGVSLGGKVVFEFASQYPDMFLGGLSLDVGPGEFEKSELFYFVDGMVRNLDLSHPYPEMKVILQNMIKDRNLRSMIQSQIFYPEKGAPGVWKSGMQNFGEMFVELLEDNDMSNQFKKYQLQDLMLAAKEKYVHVLRAKNLSGISLESIPQLEKLASVKMTMIDDASHFLHVTHKDQVVKKMLEIKSERDSLLSGTMGAAVSAVATGAGGIKIKGRDSLVNM